MSMAEGTTSLMNTPLASGCEADADVMVTVSAMG
jgi:hypothetical protein